MWTRLSILLFALGLLGCGGSGPHARFRVTPVAVHGDALGTATPTEQAGEALVIEAFITAKVDDVSATSEAIRRKVQASGGRVIHEDQSGSVRNWNSSLRLRLLPAQVDGLVGWLATHGEIVSKRIEATDVSRELFDQELALDNLGKTMARLSSILDRDDLDIEAVLKIEDAMTRVRGEIETIKGAQRFLKDRVAYATLELQLSRRDGQSEGPKTKFLAGLRGANLALLDPGSRKRSRFGFGIVLQAPDMKVSYELDVFEAADGGSRGILATAGAAAFSDHLGGGRRTFLNPYLGVRMGYGRLNGSKFVVAGSAGVEVYKSRYVKLDLDTRVTSLFGADGVDMALVSGASLSVAF